MNRLERLEVKEHRRKKMELSLIEKTRQTRIKVALKELPKYKKLINTYISIHGGREEKRNKRFVYFIVDADLLN